MYLLVCLLAITSFDLAMTYKEKKELGLCKLSEKEQLRLQNWIDNHFVKREVPLANDAPTQVPILQESFNQGKSIRLSDNSLWEIHPEDTPITQSWITPVEIFAIENTNIYYPYQLTNSLTTSTVRARKKN